MKIKAKTELFRRIEQWRRERGRNPANGSKVTGRPKGLRSSKDVSAVSLVILALQLAVDHTNRDDLRPLYQELLDEIRDRERAALGMDSVN